MKILLVEPKLFQDGGHIKNNMNKFQTEVLCVVKNIFKKSQLQNLH